MTVFGETPINEAAPIEGVEPPVDDSVLHGEVVAAPPVEHKSDTLAATAPTVAAAADDPGVPSNTIAVAASVDISTVEEWTHDWLMFKGDRLGIRVPSQQALAAFALSSGKYVPIEVKNDLTSLFIARHLSPESYGRVFSRLMDPDDPEYNTDTVGDLFEAIVETTAEKAKAEAAEAEKASAATA